MSSFLCHFTRGRLGGQIAQQLAEMGMRVVGTDIAPAEPEWVSKIMAQLESSGRSKDLKYVPSLDLTNTAGVNDLFAMAQKEFGVVNGCVHVAAWPGPASDPPFPTVVANGTPVIGLEPVSPSKLLFDNAQASWNVFNAAASVASPPCERVVFSSTLFTAGYCHDSTLWDPLPSTLPVSEECPCGAEPYETYGLSKVLGEQMADMVPLSKASIFVLLILVLFRCLALPVVAPVSSRLDFRIL